MIQYVRRTATVNKSKFLALVKSLNYEVETTCGSRKPAFATLIPGLSYWLRWYDCLGELHDAYYYFRYSEPKLVVDGELQYVSLEEVKAHGMVEEQIIEITPSSRPAWREKETPDRCGVIRQGSGKRKHLP